MVTYVEVACQRLPGLSSGFSPAFPLWQKCRLQPQTCTIQPTTMAAVNRRAASDEKAKTGGGSLVVFLFPRPGSCNSRPLARIGEANVTVSRTHTGFSLCFQVITTQHRFDDKQGRALFSDTCGKQRLSCPKFNISDHCCPN